MKITISKSQWEEMGRKAGWMKTANSDAVRYRDGNRILEISCQNVLDSNLRYDATIYDEDGAVESATIDLTLQEIGIWAKEHNFDFSPKNEALKWWGSLSINEMKELTKKYYSNSHITWSYINQTPSLIEEIYQKENNGAQK